MHSAYKLNVRYSDLLKKAKKPVKEEKPEEIIARIVDKIERL